ncbi:hypothetical protein [uncultured Shewanella sp.]|nr:hypothetical protein [uncultured Shewanella sp.]
MMILFYNMLSSACVNSITFDGWLKNKIHVNQQVMSILKTLTDLNIN